MSALLTSHQALRIAAALTAAAFDVPRDPRSPQYKAGVQTALMRHLGAPASPCKWPPGSCEHDAWNAGLDEGHTIWRALPRNAGLAATAQG